VLATVMTLALMLFGWIGYVRLPVRELPDVEFPVVSVVTVLPGASPEVMEKEVTEILEEEINTIEGIKTLTSASSEEVSAITVEFTLDRDIDTAAQDVRDKISRVRDDLPDDTEEPRVNKIDLDARAIMWLSLNSPTADLRTLSDYADRVVKERLQRLPGVGSILIGGEKRLAVRIRLDAARLAAYQLTVDDVTAALRRENVEIPSGRVESQQREFVVQTEAQFDTPESFGELIVAYREDAPVRLRQLGRAEAGDENERTLGRFNLRPTMSLGVLKQSAANTVDVARAVRAEAAALAPQLPPGYQLTVAYDSAVFIEDSVREVQDSLLIASVLVVLVIFLFLHTPRSAVIPALAIPSSILATFGVMYWLDFTLNNLTLLALTLVIGVVVDDAIIVLENVHRHLEDGEDRMTAALHGTDEIAFAALAATLTLVAVFLPVAFISGVIGRFFYEFGVSVAVSVLVSLFVALTLTPMLCSRLLVVDEPRGVFRVFEQALARFAAAYRRALETALDHRAAIVGIAVASVVGSAGLYLLLGKEFVPPEDRSGFMIALETPEGSTLEHHDRLQRRIEEILHAAPEIRAASSFVGVSQGGPGAVNQGAIFTRLHPPGERARSQAELIADLRHRFAEVPGIRAFIVAFSGLPTGQRGGKPFQFVVQHPEFAVLRQAEAALVARLRDAPGFTDVDSNLRLNKPEVRVRIDRDKAASLGVSTADVANTLRVLLGGATVTDFKRGNERYDVIVQLEAADRTAPAQLGRLYVRTRGGNLVQLASLLQVEEGVGPSSLNHYNRRRSVIVDANLVDKPLGTALAEAQQIARTILPPGASTEKAGESRDFAESFSSLFFAFALAVVAVYLVLAAQFESFVHPFTILLTLPLALLGAFASLALFGMTINIYSFIGLVMLIGLVTKNSILLVDCANRLREDGHGLRDAVVQAGALRLRPILMTAISTLFGVLPVALGLGAGAEGRRPLGVAVVGGIIVSTLLTLVVIPVVYTLLDEALVRLRARPPGGAAASGRSAAHAVSDTGTARASRTADRSATEATTRSGR
jgi:multidrug efflux pump